VASVTQQLGSRLRLPALPLRYLGVLALAPIALGVGRLLPAEGAGLGLRLAGAAACILLLPGALVLRAIDWPTRLAQALAGSLAWSLGILFLAMMLTFAADGSLSLTVAVIAIASVGGLVASLRAPPSRLRRGDLAPILAVAAAGFALCGVVWWASTVVSGDALFHLARVRKLDEFPVLSSVWIVNEFRGGGLHPGYAFPLWHGVLGLVARLAAVDPALVLLHLSAILTPLALVLAYAAGAALFASRAGGAAAAVAQAALLGFQRDGIGSFALTALPSSAARLLLVPAVLALVFAVVRGAPRVRFLTLGMAALALAVVHVTYALFLVVPLAGFLAARAALSRRGRADWRRIGGSVAALVVPTGLFVAWLWPALAETASVSPSAGEQARALQVYGASLDVYGDWYRLAPEAIARGGAATVAALLAIPAAVLAGRRRWAAYVLGGSIAILVVVLVPPFFTALSELSSLSQARRLVLFLPLPFALAGAAALAGRLRLAGCAGALGLGIGLQLAYPGGEGGRLGEAGPAWVTWLSLGGAVVALACGWFLRRTAPSPSWWAVAAIVVFALPVAIAGLRDVSRDPPDRRALTPGLVEALRTEVPLRSTVFADLETSYRIGAHTPLYVAANPPAHVADSGENEPYERRRDVVRFFYDDDVSYLDKARILAHRGASWLVVDKTRKTPAYLQFLPAPIYEDERYALYPLRRES
jgi:hypothetical protein